MSYAHFFNHNLPSLIRQIRKIKRFRQPKFYAVAVGRRVGIYRSWPSCKVQIENISNAKYRRFETHEEALRFLAQTPPETPLPPGQEVNRETDLGAATDGVIYVDGSCWRNGAVDARAGIGIYWPGHPERNQSRMIDGRQTSIRAEIWAAIIALRQAKSLGLKTVTIYTDSNFVIQTATVWLWKWKRNCWMTSGGSEVKNRYDLMALDEAIRAMKKVIWLPVTGHSGVPGNDEADRLANAAIAAADDNPDDNHHQDETNSETSAEKT